MDWELNAERKSGRMGREELAMEQNRWQTDGTISDLLTQRRDGAVVLAQRFKVVRKLGEGGMGSVWLAEDQKLDGRKVAIKMLPVVLATNQRAIQQLKAEAKVAMQLVHSHIVALRSFEDSDEGAFLVMDYVAGKTLEQLLAEKGTLSEAEVLKIFKPVAEALDHAHRHKVVHRDVKPSNIILNEAVEPFIMDFGIAREMKDSMTRVTGKNSSGTLPYMSPEQLRGEDPAPAQDVYSLAATIYECLTGNPPFYRGQIEFQIANEAPKPLTSGSPLARAVMAGLAKKAEERPATAGGLVEGRGEEGILRNARKTRKETANGRKWARMAAGLAVLAGVVVGATIWSWKGNSISDSPPPLSSSQVGQANDLNADRAEEVRKQEDAQRQAADEARKRQEAQQKAAQEKEKRDAALSRVPTGFKVVGRDMDPASGLPMTIEHEKTGYRLKLVPAGEFRMGSPAGVGNDNERPQRRIFLDAYWIGETEATCEQFAQFLNEKGNQTEGGVTWCGLAGAVKIEQRDGRFQAKSGLGQHPVVEVSWYGARAFARWMGGDLPAEAQWEKAAKGGQEWTWPWGNTWDKNKANTAERIANVAEFKTYADWLKWWEPFIQDVQNRKDYSSTTVPVKSYSQNGYGLFDMAGNVWEWCLDWYAAKAYSQLRDGQRNPTGPSSGDMQEVTYWQGGEQKTDRQACRVVRGGGWDNRAADARCALRGRDLPADWRTDLGVRVAVPPRP
jgi:formylglycine-generating enzyme required for sulfatase activity/serine/threonine protein kinase